MNTKSKLIWAAAVICLVPCWAHGEEQKENADLRIRTDLDININQSKTDLKAGINWKSKNAEKDWIPLIGFYASVPLVENDKVPGAYYDQTHHNWKIGINLELEHDAEPYIADNNSINQFQVVTFSAGWGYQEYAYYRQWDDKSPSKVGLHSWEAEANGIWSSRKRSSGIRWTPQIRLRYVYDWKEADKVGVVIPSTGTGPDIVKDRIIEKPGIIPLYSIRPAFTVFKDKWGAGAGWRYNFLGSGGGSKSKQETQETSRVEAMIYYLPLAVGVTNLRVGFGGFWENVTRNASPADLPRYGAMVQVKFNQISVEF